VGNDALFLYPDFAGGECRRRVQKTQKGAKYGMSISHLQRMFMRILGVRPGKYIIQQRLNVACRMLEETDKTVNDIAISSGFCDQSHLTKMFKQERKTTPGEYRRIYRIHA
jgi:AraC-like DNA-binding protein